MSVKVLFFASLSERLDLRQVDVEVDQVSDPAQVFCDATGLTELESGILIAVNQEYAEADAVVKDGDEVAFFPPVTGG